MFLESVHRWDTKVNKFSTVSSNNYKLSCKNVGYKHSNRVVTGQGKKTSRTGKSQEKLIFLGKVKKN